MTRTLSADMHTNSAQEPCGAILLVRDLTVRFGAVIANDHVHLAADHGVVTGVIGPNGAGKSTLLDAIGGFLPASGRVTLAGRDISGLASHKRARSGLGRTFQSAQLFNDLTVEENLNVSAGPAQRADSRGSGRSNLARETLSALGIEDLAHLLPTRLSTGQRRLAAIARALVARPKVLLMDEPAAGLSKPERETLKHLITKLARGGMAVVLVDHDVDLVLSISAQVYVLSAGRLLAEGDPSAIRASAEVREAYLGGAVEDTDHG